MEDTNLSSVNAESEVVVEPQQDTTVNEPVNAGSEETANPQTDSKPVQTAEQNSEFAKVRRETESKFRERQDKFAKQYGYDSFEELEQAQQQQQIEEANQKFEEEHGINPNDIKPLFEQWKQTDPDFQELANSRAEKAISTALSDLNNELKDAGLDLNLKDLSESEVAKLPNVDKIIDLVQNKKHSLADAFFLANKKDIIGKQAMKAQQETIAKISANGASSPGSLVNHGTEETFFTKEQVEKMSKEEVRKNYDKIIKSTNKW